MPQDNRLRRRAQYVYQLRKWGVYKYEVSTRTAANSLVQISSFEDTVAKDPDFEDRMTDPKQGSTTRRHFNLSPTDCDEASEVTMTGSELTLYSQPSCDLLAIRMAGGVPSEEEWKSCTESEVIRIRHAADLLSAAGISTPAFGLNLVSFTLAKQMTARQPAPAIDDFTSALAACVLTATTATQRDISKSILEQYSTSDTNIQLTLAFCQVVAPLLMDYTEFQDQWIRRQTLVQTKVASRQMKVSHERFMSQRLGKYTSPMFISHLVATYPRMDHILQLLNPFSTDTSRLLLTRILLEYQADRLNANVIRLSLLTISHIIQRYDPFYGRPLERTDVYQHEKALLCLLWEHTCDSPGMRENGDDRHDTSLQWLFDCRDEYCSLPCSEFLNGLCRMYITHPKRFDVPAQRVCQLLCGEDDETLKKWFIYALQGITCYRYSGVSPGLSETVTHLIRNSLGVDVVDEMDRIELIGDTDIFETMTLARSLKSSNSSDFARFKHTV